MNSRMVAALVSMTHGHLAGWQPDYRLHQPGCGRQVLSGGEGTRGSERDRPRQRAPARFAGARGDLLRHRVGAIHAVLVPRSAALPVGRLAVAAGPLGPSESSRQIRHFAGTKPSGSRTRKETL